MNKQTETTERTRQNLVDAFWALYTTKRIDKISVREITSKAGYNRGTFYEYFRDVYDVLEYIENRCLPTLADLPPLIDLNTHSPAIITSFMQLYQEKYTYYNVLLGDNGDPAFQRKMKNSLKNSILQTLSTKEGVDLLTIDFMLEYILSGLIGILMYSFQNRRDLPDEQFYPMLYGLLQGDVVGKLQKLMG